MCGIIGYLGPQEAMPIILDGLKRLEYRGYDSAGMAVIGDHGLAIRRSLGKLKELENLLRQDPLQGQVGIGDERDSRTLVGVEFGHVDVDKVHIRVFKERHRGGGEIGVARADADHQVGFAGQAVGGQVSRRSHGAHALRVVVRQGALAGLCFCYRDAGLLGEKRQGLGGLTVNYPAPGNDQRAAAGADGIESGKGA